jgi:hypothetical protein
VKGLGFPGPLPFVPNSLVRNRIGGKTMEKKVFLSTKFLKGIELLVQDLEERRERGITDFSSEILHIRLLLNLSGTGRVDPESRLLLRRLSSLGASTFQTEER